LRVLGIESSCDETAAAVVEDGVQIRSNIVSSQVEVHRPYGGVVPELASRHHLQNITFVVERALSDAAAGLADLDGVAVTCGPGLVGALLVGVQVAKALCYVADLPLVGVNHLEGHLQAARLGGAEPPERHVALLVSGGHTALILVEGFGHYRMIGRSRDDAAGEAFDKVAKLLGLGYPGGPIVERLAARGDREAVRFPRALPRRDELDFSFSGLKTAVANHVRQHGVPDGAELHDLCASFQQAVADVLVRKASRAVRLHRVTTLVAAGGVLANQAVRDELARAAQQEGFSLCVPPVALCTDNAAMIAAAGTEHLRRGHTSGMDLNASPRLPL
jgi:N6-L-threonylcarbamoyladenine synthase